MKSRTQGSRPRPRTQKKSEAKDSLSEDRHSRGQGQKCSRPRTKDTSASALQIKKKSSQKFFRRSPKKKKGLHNNFSCNLKKNKKKEKKNKVFHKNFSSDLQKKVFTKIFLAISTKKRFPKNFLSAPQNFNNSKNSAVLESRTGQFSRT